MMYHALKTSLLVAVLAVAAQDANAFGHRWGGCGYGGCGYAGYGYGGYGCYGGGCGYGYGGYGYTTWAGGYPGYGYGGYAGAGFGGYAAGLARSTPPQAHSYGTDENTSMRLTVNVPADAKVFINDYQTKSTGTQRTFTTKGLQASKAYDYQVRAEFVRDGKPVTENKKVQLIAGQSAIVSFEPLAQAKVADIDTAAQR